MPINKAVLEHKTQLTHDVIELTFKTEQEFDFKAGQYISIKVMDQPEKPCFRAYSIASPPSDKHSFDLCLKVIPEGRATNWLNFLTQNTEIEFLGPIGQFSYKGEKGNALFIATGTGLAPFRSIIEDELAKGNQRKIHLIFGVRHEKDIFYQDIFETLAQNYANFSFDLTLSRPEPTWQGNKGRVTALLETLKITPSQTEAYICGLTDMIESTEKILIEKGLPQEAIHFEKYD